MLYVKIMDMLGAIIGDIVGSRFEFNPTNDFNFELFTDECGFTDDTICTCAIADALLNGKDFGDSLHKWCRLYPHPKGSYGGRFAQWVHSDNPQPYGSYGNGSAMRVSPVGWLNYSRTYILSSAEQTASCTHNHPEGIKGAQAVALAIHVANAGRRCNQSATDIVKNVIKECVEFSGYNINIRKEDVQNRFDETCQGTVPVALWIINQSNGFEEAVRRAVSLGADADTLGAIVGSIAEAIWGIPETIKASALSHLDDRMKKLLHKWKRSNLINGISIKKFTEKYIDYFLNNFDPESASYYDLFDSRLFPHECWSLGFEMNCGKSITEAYGEEIWASEKDLSMVIDKMKDLRIMGSALFSKWRYFSHWSWDKATEEDKEWFLMLLRRMQELASESKYY